MKIASCVRTLVCPAEWMDGWRELPGITARAPGPRGGSVPRLRSRTTPRARAQHHRGRSGAASTSGCVTTTRDSDNVGRHGRYSAAGVSIGTERASITTTTTRTAAADRPSWASLRDAGQPEQTMRNCPDFADVADAAHGRRRPPVPRPSDLRRYRASTHRFPVEHPLNGSSDPGERQRHIHIYKTEVARLAGIAGARVMADGVPSPPLVGGTRDARLDVMSGDITSPFAAGERFRGKRGEASRSPTLGEVFVISRFTPRDLFTFVYSCLRSTTSSLSSSYYYRVSISPLC